MSGRHRVVKPRRSRQVLHVLALPGRIVLGACLDTWCGWRSRVVDAVLDAIDWLEELWDDRFGEGDPFAGVHLDPQATSPDPVPAPVEEEEPGPAPLPLAPQQVLPALRTQHPHLPVAHVLWHVNDLGVSGEVNALEADAATRRRIVELFADALAAQVEEAPDGDVLTVYTTGEVGTVPVTVAAVLLAEEAVPLGVYAEAVQDPTLTDAQSTQRLPDELIREVVSA